MSQVQSFIDELEHEAKGARTTLERLPDDQWDWTPHAKSSKLGELASHVADMPGWIPTILTTPELTIDLSMEPSVAGSCREVLARWDDNLAKGLAALRQTDEAALAQPWSLKMGDRVIFTLPRADVLRVMVIKHLVHHRAQLGLYLRLNDVPVPSIYGPSADES